MSTNKHNSPYKKTNHLASVIDKQASKGKTLPSYLGNQFSLLQEYTKAVRKVLASDIPKEELATSWVVTVAEHHITIAVSSVTLANHLNYMVSKYLCALKASSPLFKDITRIKVIVSHPNNRHIN